MWQINKIHDNQNWQLPILCGHNWKCFDYKSQSHYKRLTSFKVNIRLSSPPSSRPLSIERPSSSVCMETTGSDVSMETTCSTGSSVSLGLVESLLAATLGPGTLLLRGLETGISVARGLKTGFETVASGPEMLGGVSIAKLGPEPTEGISILEGLVII